MKILVTGANGYLGVGVVKSLLDNGQSVVATDLAIDKIDERAESFAVNIFNIDDPYTFFGKPDVILHLAWRDGFKHNSGNHIGDLNNHMNFLSKMIESGIKRVAILGSMHEVGFFEGSINETTPCNPGSFYGIAKNALRQAITLKTKEYNTILQWIRGYYIVGNTDAGCSIFSKIVAAAKAGQKVFPFTTGENQYDFIDYDDFCKNTAAIVCQDSVNGIINCCSGKPLKLKERVESFIKENNFDITLQYGAFPDRPYDSKAVWGSTEKLDLIIKK